MEGTVESIHLAVQESGPTHSVTSVLALAGRGLEGDRYLAPAGETIGSGEALTLVEAEVLETVAREQGIDLSDGRSRRQLHTRGIRLNELVDCEFTVGEVRCRGVELCEPCEHLQSMTENGVIKALVHRGGLRADILAGGSIAVGDPVVGELRP